MLCGVQFRLGRVITVAPNSKGIVRDVEVLFTPGNCASVHQQPETHSKWFSNQRERSNGVVLHRDVARSSLACRGAVPLSKHIWQVVCLLSFATFQAEVRKLEWEVLRRMAA